MSESDALRAPLPKRLRIRWKKLGGHIHCRMFSASSTWGDTYGKNGDLCFDEREWPEVERMLSRIADVLEDTN